MSELSAMASITIGAPAEEVWKAITTPDLIQQWFFGVETRSTWEVGSPIVHTGTYEGRPYVDKGEITRFEPPRVLAHTHWSDVSGLPDEPANYQHVTWELAARDGATELTISETNLPSESAQSVSEQSWKTVLQNLKDLLERRAT